MFLYLKIETELASKMSCILQEIRQWTKSQKKKIVSGNFCHAVFSLLDFLTLEAGTERLSQNVRAELSHTAQYLRRV
jgi:hypothetical protein